jgi:alkanesulfonate monooxygenase SsuD/methylene tetrahydromethanopterin reductase-like flavin-dependent oxidoreductase (luciferase family)
MIADGIRIGFSLTIERPRIRSLEDAGVDSLWVGGHIATPNGVQEGIVALSRLVENTEHVIVGSSILLLPLYPPAIVAKVFADLDHASGGRVHMGVGIGGEHPGEFSACQIPLTERGRRADEAIPLIRRLWSGEPVDHDGRFYPMRDVRILPAPLRPNGPPIHVSGRSEAAMRRAARLGDGWMPYLYSARRYAASLATIRDHAAEIGRDLTAFETFAFVFTSVHRDHDTAVELAAKSLGGTYNQDFRQIVRSVAAAGTPREVADQLQAFVDAGARHLILAPCAREDRASMDRILLDEVLPCLHLPGRGDDRPSPRLAEGRS